MRPGYRGPGRPKKAESLPRLAPHEIAVTVAPFFGHDIVDSFEELPHTFRDKWSQAARLGYFRDCRLMGEYRDRFCDYIKGGAR